MACLVYRKSAGRLPRSLEEVDSAGGEGDGLVECGMELRWVSLGFGVGYCLWWALAHVWDETKRAMAWLFTLSLTHTYIHICKRDSEEQVQASLAAMRESFAQFAESFLALTKVGRVFW